jgi:hypothetical protein
MKHDRPEPADAPHAGYERSDASVRPVFLFTIALTLVVTGVVLAMVAFFDYLERLETVGAPHPMAAPVEAPPPRLQTTTGDDLAAQRERDEALAREYAWIDRPAGVVRIPVERALELTAQRGLPARK